MRPDTLKPSNNGIISKIFLDSGDPGETKKAIELLGNLDGQTTNPSLVAKNPEVQKRLESGSKFTNDLLLSYYKDIVKEVSELIPQGSVSIEVYADKNSTTKELLDQAEKMYQWIANAHIKFPTTKAGLQAAEEFVNQGGRVNMTLVFSQKQALAVHQATAGMKKKSSVFLSPFIGRLDDIGLNGLDLVKNCIQQYQELDSMVEVLAASTRSVEHLIACLHMGVDIVTIPLKLIEPWVAMGKPASFGEEKYEADLETIPYLNLENEITQDNWQKVDIYHQLTDKGLAKFAEDWNNLLG
jgi:transaldolase